MGRPLRKQNFGNTSQSNNQLQVLADIGAGTELCWIMDQPGSRTYTLASVVGGSTPTRTGRAKLQLADPSAVGEAQLDVSVFGVSAGDGTAEVSILNLSAASAVVTTTGSGYNVGDAIDTNAGGTFSVAAGWTVNDISTVAGQTEADFSVFTGGDAGGGTASVVLDVYTMDDGSTVRVDAIDGNGDVTEFTVLTASTSGIVGDTQVVSFASQLSGTGDNILFDMTMETATQGIFDVADGAAGVYTVLPINPSATSTAGGGSGATLTVSWGINALTIDTAGTGYTTGAVVSVTGGNGTLSVASVGGTGDITGMTIDTAGTGHAIDDQITIEGVGTEHAKTILQHVVKTWEGNTYSWKLDVAAAVTGEADLQSA